MLFNFSKRVRKKSKWSSRILNIVEVSASNKSNFIENSKDESEEEEEVKEEEEVEEEEEEEEEEEVEEVEEKVEENTQKELKFIHITKTAGTTIENIAKDKDILWGRFHKEYFINSRKSWSQWHEIFVNKPMWLKIKYDWFTVVRNPYDRVISEFYCKWGWGKGHVTDLNYMNRKKFNNFILKKILKRCKIGEHYTEQFKYIDNCTTIHILKYENLKEEFDNLMKKYNLNIRLDRHDNKSKFKKTFSKESLSAKVIKIINEVYIKDFELFGYEKIK